MSCPRRGNFVRLQEERQRGISCVVFAGAASRGCMLLVSLRRCCTHPSKSSLLLQCCTEVDVHGVPRSLHNPTPRLARTALAPSLRAKTLCLMCGKDLTSSARARRETPSNFKAHYATAHLDQFNGEGVINWELCLYELEVFRKVVAGLRSLNFHLLPCCLPGAIA